MISNFIVPSQSSKIMDQRPTSTAATIDEKNVPRILYPEDFKWKGKTHPEPKKQGKDSSAFAVSAVQYSVYKHADEDDVSASSFLETFSALVGMGPETSTVATTAWSGSSTDRPLVPPLVDVDRDHMSW